MNYEEYFSKCPDRGWMENGQPYFNVAKSLDPDEQWWVYCAGTIFYQGQKRHSFFMKDYEYVDFNGYNRSVSRTVAEIFVPRPVDATEVHHKDGNKRNNRFTNLMWLTHAQHMAIHHGKAVVMLDINTRKLIDTFPSAKAAADATGFPVTSIRGCTNHTTQSSNGFIWMKAAEYFHTDDAA